LPPTTAMCAQALGAETAPARRPAGSEEDVSWDAEMQAAHGVSGFSAAAITGGEEPDEPEEARGRGAERAEEAASRAGQKLRGHSARSGLRGFGRR
jgi:hypothetical protein